MSRSWSTFWQVFFAAESGASLYGFIAALLVEGPTMLGSFFIDEYFLKVASVFALLFGLFMLIALFWPVLKKRKWFSRLVTSQSEEFGSLHEEISSLRDELVAIFRDKNRESLPLDFIMKISELRAVLVGLDIETPPFVPGFENEKEAEKSGKWLGFLLRLAAASRVKDLKTARGIISDTGDETV